MTRFRTTVYAVTLLLLLLCFRQEARAQVRISEFLVTNTAGILDDDGTPQPWVEIWNTNRVSAQSLLNWRLTDGSTQWLFPAISLPPNERIVVFLSGKNRRTVTAPLHANFLPNPQGGNLQLLDTGAVLSNFTYPAQTANVSYGTDAVQTGFVGFYQTPTPGSPNNYSGAGVAGRVLFSLESCAFSGSVSISLSLQTPATGAEIRYTQDGSAPLSTSTLYTGAPITVNTTRQIRARVFEPGKLPGEIEAECYLLLDASTQNFTSGMPLIVLTNFGAGTPVDGNGNPPDNAGYMWVWEPSPGDGRSRFTDNPKIHSRVAMDRRGSSTLGNPKFNLNVESRMDRDEEEKDVVLLGMPAHSDWVFHAPYSFDRTLIHNPFMYALSNSIGRYAPRTRKAEVFVDVNGGSLSFTNSQSGDYFGVYNVMEKIRRGTDRVNIAKLNPYDNGAVTRTGGYIIKVDRRDSGDSGFSTSRESLLSYYYPKEVDLVSNQRDPQEQYIRAFMQAFDTSCYATTWRDPVSGYRRYLDVPAAIDHHLMNVWSFNVDALRLSGYMTIDRGGRIMYGPIWDFDRALCSTDGRDANPLTWRSTTGDLGTDFFNYTWWNRLFQDPDFYQAYIDRWVELRRSAFSQDAVNTLIDGLNNSITAEAVARDLVRWNQSKRGGTGSFPPARTYTANQDGEILRMKDWLQARADFMETQWVRPVTIHQSSGRVVPGTTVTMSAPAGTIYYTLDGSDPRPTGGAVPSAANVFVYSGPITINETTRIRARAFHIGHSALTGANNPPAISRWSGRTDARFSVDPPAAAGILAVTEINYHPTAPSAAELLVNPQFVAADFEFVELKNIGTTPLDLANAQFTLGITFSFTGERAISLAPGEYVIVSGNPAAFAARYGSMPNVKVVGPFQGDLSNSGERLVIMAENADIILDFVYNDAWYPETDGPGRTLVVYDQGASGSAYSSAANWRSSVANGGSPGTGEPPFVTTTGATAITATSVQLNAFVSSNGVETQPEFVLGDTRYSAETIPAGAPAGAVSYVVTGLNPHTEYTFRAEATNTLGARVGSTLTFTTLNRSPQATDKVIHFASRNPATLQVLGNDSDPDGDTLTLTAVTQPERGTVEIDGNAVLFTPAPDGTGNDTFTYTVSDGFGGSATATVTLFNTAPVALDDVIFSDGGAVTFDPRPNDTDADGDLLRVESVSDGTRGTVSIIGDGSITYTPASGFFGRDSFNYTLTDGAISVTAQVQVRNTVSLLRAGLTKGGPVPQQTGSVYGKLDPPSEGAISSGTIKKGKTVRRAIFGADGSVLLKVGDPAPEISGAKIAGLSELNGQAVLATLKGGVTKASNVVLYTGLAQGPIQVAARTGTMLPDSVKIKKILSFDGNGSAVFFRAQLAGVAVNRTNDVALFGWSAELGLRQLAREGGVVGDKVVSTLGTLFASAKTTAEQRWRTEDAAIGIQLKFLNSEQAFFTIPITAASAGEWTEWARTGDQVGDTAAITSLRVPGFAPTGPSYVAQIKGINGGLVLTPNDTVVIRTIADGPSITAQEGKGAPDYAGTVIPGVSFVSFLDPVAGSDGRTTFIASIAGAGVTKATATGVWHWDEADGLRMIARAGDLAPDGGRWASFDSLVLPNGPESAPIFVGKLKINALDGVTARSNQGLWAVDSEGELRLLLRTGKPLTVNGVTRTVKSFIALRPSANSLGAANGFNDAQRVTAVTTFTDGTQMVLNVAIP